MCRFIRNEEVCSVGFEALAMEVVVRVVEDTSVSKGLGWKHGHKQSSRLEIRKESELG